MAGGYPNETKKKNIHATSRGLRDYILIPGHQEFIISYMGSGVVSDRRGKRRRVAQGRKGRGGDFCLLHKIPNTLRRHCSKHTAYSKVWESQVQHMRWDRVFRGTYGVCGRTASTRAVNISFIPGSRWRAIAPLHRIFIFTVPPHPPSTSSTFTSDRSAAECSLQ